jgi:phage terminase large subunit-like protein
MDNRLQELFIDKIKKSKEGDNFGIIIDNKSISLQVTSVDPLKLRGKEFSAIIIDEVQEVKPEDIDKIRKIMENQNPKI